MTKTTLRRTAEENPPKAIRRSLRSGATLLINTPLQWGEIGPGTLRNRFNGFRRPDETVETVSRHSSPWITSLKRGANERCISGRGAPPIDPLFWSLMICLGWLGFTHARAQDPHA